MLIIPTRLKFQTESLPFPVSTNFKTNKKNQNKTKQKQIKKQTNKQQLENNLNI